MNSLQFSVFYLVIILIGLGLVVGAYTFLSRSHNDDGHIEVTPTCATCDGNNAKCEQECMMEAAIKEIEYFDDEELDAYKGRAADAYTDDEVEEFREVLYTMRPEEVKDWNRSLILRGVNLPNQLKDEVIMMIEN